MKTTKYDEWFVVSSAAEHPPSPMATPSDAWGAGDAGGRWVTQSAS